MVYYDYCGFEERLRFFQFLIICCRLFWLELKVFFWEAVGFLGWGRRDFFRVYICIVIIIKVVISQLVFVVFKFYQYFIMFFVLIIYVVVLQSYVSKWRKCQSFYSWCQDFLKKRNVFIEKIFRQVFGVEIFEEGEVVSVIEVGKLELGQEEGLRRRSMWERK